MPDHDPGQQHDGEHLDQREGGELFFMAPPAPVGSPRSCSVGAVCGLLAAPAAAGDSRARQRRAASCGDALEVEQVGGARDVALARALQPGDRDLHASAAPARRRRWRRRAAAASLPSTSPTPHCGGIWKALTSRAIAKSPSVFSLWPTGGSGAADQVVHALVGEQRGLEPALALAFGAQPLDRDAGQHRSRGCRAAPPRPAPRSA